MYQRIALTILCVTLAAGSARADLVSHWTLDEIVGTTVYDSGPGGNDGTVHGDLTPIDGVIGGALEFQGEGRALGTGVNYIDCGSDASLDITSNISIALWIKPDADDPEGTGMETAPMSKATGGWSWQARYGWASSQPYMGWQFNSTTGSVWVYTGQNLEQGEWCHIACSHDGATLKCYLNGEETDSTPMAGITSSATPVLIGSDGWGSDWIGGIDDVRIYNHAITEDDLVTIMAAEPIVTAYAPAPKDGTMIYQIATLLEWQAGAFGNAHDVYFGDDLEAVSAATPDDTDVYAGRLTTGMLPVGTGSGPHPDALVPGTTYY